MHAEGWIRVRTRPGCLGQHTESVMTDRDVIARLDAIILVAAERHLVLVVADLLDLACAQIVHIWVLHKPRGWVPHNGVEGTFLQEHPVVWVAVVPLHKSQLVRSIAQA